MKDLLHICLELEAQGHDMTFKACNLGSKRPHLHRAYVLGVCNDLGTTVGCIREVGISYLSSNHNFNERILFRMC